MQQLTGSPPGAPARSRALPALRLLAAAVVPAVVAALVLLMGIPGQPGTPQAPPALGTRMMIAACSAGSASPGTPACTARHAALGSRPAGGTQTLTVPAPPPPWAPG